MISQTNQRLQVGCQLQRHSLTYKRFLALRCFILHLCTLIASRKCLGELLLNIGVDAAASIVGFAGQHAGRP